MYPTPEIERVLTHATTWPDAELRTNPSGGVDVVVGSVVVGSAHGDVVDLAFTPSIRDQLLTEGRADRHYSDPQSSWVSVRARTGEDLRDVRWVLRFAYLCRLRDQYAAERDGSEVDIDAEFERLGLSTSLRLLTRRATVTADPPSSAV